MSAGSLLAQQRPLSEGLRGGTLSVAKAELIARTVKALAGDTAELEAKPPAPPRCWITAASR